MNSHPVPTNGARHAVRARVLEQLTRQFQVGKGLVVMEAQAGQGKTTAATQFFSQSGIKPVWYSLRLQDRDPIQFLEGLHNGLRSQLPGYQAPLLAELLGKGILAPSEHERAADLLIAALRNSGSEPYLVLDDVHRLDPGSATADLLRRLATAAPKPAALLMLSRQPVLETLSIMPGTLPVGRIDNRDLAFTPAEIGELFTETLGISVATEDVSQLATLTEGWAIGLLLMAARLEAGHGLNTVPSAHLDLLQTGQIPDYFRAQILDRLAASERRDLLRLSLLDQIPLDLAQQLAPETRLSDLLRSNVFLRETAPDALEFHHLFHDSLRRLADEELPPKEQQALLQAASQWHYRRNDGARALGYLLRAGDFSGANRLAADVGLQLLANNRIVLLHELLCDLEAEIVAEHAWLALLLGLALLSSDPPQAFAHLESARSRFRERGDGRGELLAIAQLMYFHIVVDTRYQCLDPLLDRAEPLFQKHVPELSPAMRVECAQYISYAITHADKGMDKAADYSRYALTLAEQHQMDNAAATVACNRAYEGALRGDWRFFARCMDDGYALQKSPYVTTFVKFLQHFAQINLLFVSGDFFNYRHKLEVVKRELNRNLFDRTLCRPFLYIYAADMAVSEGRMADARDLMLEMLDRDRTLASDHMRSQFLHYAACIAAIDGDTDAVHCYARESQELRRRSGHPFHRHMNHLVLGGAYARIGAAEQAQAHLNEVLAYAARQHERSLAPGAWCYKAWLSLTTGDETAAVASLREGLRQMQRRRYTTFISWDPQLMRPLLALAVREGVEVKYARHLAAERLQSAILDTGELVPLLEIRALGGLHLELGNRVIDSGRLTPAQRELLTTLAAAPSASLTYEEVQLALWPDAPPDKVRARLDTLVARLRKLLSARADGARGAYYLVMENKCLRLTHCKIDLQDFEHHTRLGLTQARRREYWQASNSLRRGHSYWGGPLPGGNRLLDDQAEKLRMLYCDSVLLRADVLAVGGENTEARAAVSQAVGGNPTDERLVARLHQLFAAAGDAAGASRIMRDYEAALRQEGYSADEIAELRERFWAGEAARVG